MYSIPQEISLIQLVVQHSHKQTLEPYHHLQHKALQLFPNFYQHYHLQMLKHLHQSFFHRHHFHDLYPYIGINVVVDFSLELFFYQKNQPNNHDEKDHIFCHNAHFMQDYMPCAILLELVHPLQVVYMSFLQALHIFFLQDY